MEELSTKELQSIYGGNQMEKGDVIAVATAVAM